MAPAPVIMGKEIEPGLRARRGRLGLLPMACALSIAFGAPAMAENWTMRDYGDFSKDEASKAQVYIKKAMVESMDKAAEQAAEIRAAEMLDYGLGLALGRDPATEVVDNYGKDRVQKLFVTAMSVYQRDLGRDANIGYDPRVFNSPDFWIWMARMLSMSPRSSINVDSTVAAAASGSSSSQGGGGQGDSVATTVSGVQVVEDGDLEGPDGNSYTLKGDLPILDPRVVSAAHACADYAYTAARMQRVAELDPNTVAGVTPDKMRDLQQQAQQLFELAVKRGPTPCGSSEFFGQVESYAEGHLGKLGTFKVAGQTAARPPGTAPTP